ncbi:TfuA-like protein [Fangia hongkongensis]|uniref:TfuA-like protein n=1 Tax=Fangia hongkongensis TaxID=270495 RepID=UPI00036E42C5|nr:TfuA-like protein [Fangia hongkongensis]MBK2125602.1 hypothetical protein [Fangia hongkongensis]
MSQFSPHKTIVFSETTLSKKEVHVYLPQAKVVSSIKTGDMIQALNDGFSLAIIIDGNFDFVSSVWHKEILYAIEKDMIVIGVSSMGALRAAELYPYGMLGSGYVFESYKNNVTTDDSEVAISYYRLDETLQSTLALINIRYSLSQIKNVVPPVLESIFNKAKSIYYKGRTWAELQAALTESEYALLKQSYVDIKEKDAKDALRNLTKIIESSASCAIKVPKTVFLKKLIRDVSYQDEIKGIVAILKEKYQREALALKETRVESADDVQANELAKLLEVDKAIAAFAINLIAEGNISLTEKGFQQSLAVVRKNLGLLDGNQFKEWCLNHNLDFQVIEQTFRSYLLLRRAIY